MLLIALSLLHLASAAPGDTTCSTGGGSEITCSYYEQCTDITGNPSINTCIAKGNEACITYSLLGSDGTPAALQECEPSQSCCDGVCCDIGTSCVTQRSGVFRYDDVTYNAGNLARNDWKLPGGAELANEPRVCSATEFVDSFVGLKTSLVPLLGAITIGLGSFGILKQDPKGVVMMFPANIVMLTCSFFLLFSPMWIYALLSSFIAVVSIATVGKYLKWLLFFQFVMFWFFIGGSTLFLGGSISTSSNYLVSLSSQSVQGAAASCASYYGHFTYDATNRDYKVSSVRDSWGYCSLEWTGFEATMALFNLFAFFFLLFTTALRVASGIDSKKSLAAQDDLGELGQ